VRIGFDITSLRVSQGGIYWYNLNLLRALLDADREDEYLLLDYLPVRSARPLPEQVLDLERPGVQIVRCDGMGHRRLARWRVWQRLGLRRLASLIDRTVLRPWAAAAKSSMRRELDRALGHVNVFHSSSAVQWRPPGGLSALTIYDMATRVLPSLHSADERDVQSIRHEFARREADVVIAISEHTRRDIVTYLGIEPARIQIVPGGVGSDYRPYDSPSALADALAPFRLSPRRYVLHVGTVEARKNLPRLVEAFGQARRFVPAPGPSLVLAGAPGYRAAEVSRRANELGLGRYVQFLGQVPRASLPALYGGALALVYPSLYEGFGLPPLEAMACGTPVIAANSSAIREVVGSAGMLVDPYDVGELGRAIRSVLTDAARSARLREAGLERSKIYTWDVAAQRLLDAYRGASATALH
jgi:glycosyltransferase involved in cell wall biosynthesis